MSLRALRPFVLAVLLAGAAACGSSVNLQTDLEVTEVTTAWFDDGIDPPTGWNHMVPGVTFRLRNRAEHPITNVQMTAAFWIAGDDGEKDSLIVRGIGDEALEPGGQTEPIVVRAHIGYNLEGARADLFSHGSFRDWVVKLFAKRGGRIVPVGEYPVERRIVFQSSGPGRP